MEKLERILRDENEARERSTRNMEKMKAEHLVEINRLQNMLYECREQTDKGI